MVTNPERITKKGRINSGLFLFDNLDSAVAGFKEIDA